MKQAVLSHWDAPMWSVTALMLFVISFAVYAYWTYRKENKKFYEQASLLPLEEAKRK